MKSILNTFVKTIIFCAGTGAALGVWEACTTLTAAKVTKDAYNEGYEKGLEMSKKIPETEEESN